MRKTLTRHIMTLPIGLLDSLGSGKVRKQAQESTQSTETRLAHPPPDKAGKHSAMPGPAEPIILPGRRTRPLRPAAVASALIVTPFPITGPTPKKKPREHDKAPDAKSNEAVAHIRGIPAAKTFGQTDLPFKRHKDTIRQYRT